MNNELQKLVDSNPKYIIKSDERDFYGVRIYFILADHQYLGYYNKSERDANFQILKNIIQ